MKDMLKNPLRFITNVSDRLVPAVLSVVSEPTPEDYSETQTHEDAQLIDLALKNVVGAVKKLATTATRLLFEMLLNKTAKQSKVSDAALSTNVFLQSLDMLDAGFGKVAR